MAVPSTENGRCARKSAIRFARGIRGILTPFGLMEALRKHRTASVVLPACAPQMWFAALCRNRLRHAVRVGAMQSARRSLAMLLCLSHRGVLSAAFQADRRSNPAWWRGILLVPAAKEGSLRDTAPGVSCATLLISLRSSGQRPSATSKSNYGWHPGGISHAVGGSVHGFQFQQTTSLMVCHHHTLYSFVSSLNWFLRKHLHLINY